MTPNERAVQVHDLLRSKTSGTLCTHAAMMEGFPYGSIAPFAIDADGSPVFLFSRMAVHTKNIQANPKASLLVYAEADGLAGGRVNLFGEITAVTDQTDIARLRVLYLSRHPEAVEWVYFGDFDFYSLALANIYWVGGFGAIGWTTVEAYQSCLST